MQAVDPARASGAPIERQPHAILDHASRQTKARKIAKLLARRRELSGASVLDVGTGSGHIAEHFLDAVGPAGRVAAVDRVNQLCTAQVAFSQVTGPTLPFAAQSFDVVITNHVIEHVGDRPAQLAHLREIRRVLKPGGIVYLAVPNRWQVMEHHFDLPLLSWLPQRLASAYVRAMRRGSHYDCTPLSRRALLSLFRDAGLVAEPVTLEALRLVAAEEMRGIAGRVLSMLPDPVLRLPMAIIPTHVVLGTPGKDATTPCD